MKRIQVITAVFAAAAGAAIAWSLPLPDHAASSAAIQVKTSSACVCPSVEPATIASITARLQSSDA